jgi:hypothetical protein
MWREPSQNCNTSVSNKKATNKTENTGEIMGKCRIQKEIDRQKQAKEELCHKRQT